MTTVRVNLRNNAITQYGGYLFNSHTVFRGVPLGAGDSGIFTLNVGDRDIYSPGTDGQRIPAWFELPMTQLGEGLVKQGRRLYISGEFAGGMTLTAATNSATARAVTYTVAPRNTKLLQHTVEVPLSYKQRSEYWGFLMENIDGADFSIDSIDGVYVPVVRRLGL